MEKSIKTKIRVLFLGKPKGGKEPTDYPYTENPEWPIYKGRFSSKALSKYYAEKLKEFETDDVELTGKNLIRTEKELAAITEDIKKEAGIVIFIVGLFPGQLSSEIISWGMPTIMVNPVETPQSPLPWLANFGPAEGKTNVIPVLSSDFSDVGRKIAVIKAIDKLKHTKLLFSHDEDYASPKKNIPMVIGKVDEKTAKRLERIRYHGNISLTDEDFQKFKEKFGLEIKPILSKRLVEAYEASSITEAEEFSKIYP